MTHFAHDEAVAGVDAGDESEGADQGSGCVGENVAVQVGRHDDVESIWLPEKAVDHGIDELLVHINGGVSSWPTVADTVLLLDCSDGLAEQTVGRRKHVRLVADSDLVKVACSCCAKLRLELLTCKGYIECFPSNPSRGSLRDLADSLGNFSFGRLFDSFRLDVLAETRA